MSLQTLLRLLLGILRGPLTADEAAALGGNGEGMEGVTAVAHDAVDALPPLAEGPVIDLGGLLGRCCCPSASLLIITELPPLAQLPLAAHHRHMPARLPAACRPGAAARGARGAPADLAARAGAAGLPLQARSSSSWPCTALGCLQNGAAWRV